ncbi:MAG: ABC transporter ATP-binding protein, partial [Betaproteobacteria bacterium]|nr:ABC transporter ATP-binding protein [Betaproteobacteria bacterium]
MKSLAYRWPIFLALAFALLILPIGMQELGAGWVRILALAMLYILLALGLNIV